MNSNLIRKIIFISYLPLTAKVYGDFFMAELQQAGFQVEYLDITALFHDLDVEKTDDPIIRKIYTYPELKHYLHNQDKTHTLFISQITFEWRCLKLYRYLTLEHCLLGRFANNMVPVPQTSGAPFFKRLRHLTATTLVNRLKTRLLPWLKKCGYVKPHDIIFHGGQNGWQTIGIGANQDMAAGRIVPINSTDYTTYQTLKSSPQPVEKPYAVFLDEYLPLHPDFKLLQMPTIEAESYYENLNRFFREIEQQNDISVVIAAHPKALKYHEKNYFEGRPVIFGETGRLVRDCQFVLAHGSTSCGFAVLFDKPITILSSESIAREMPWYHQIYKSWATTLGALFLSYDQPAPRMLYKPADRTKYRTYKYRFLTSPESENKKNLDILIDFLERYPR